MGTQLDGLRERGEIRRFRPAELIFLEGEVGTDVFLVESGLVKIYVTAPNGDELILGLHGKGELIGEMAVLGQAARSASAMGHTAGSLFRVSGKDFRAFLVEHPDAMTHVLHLAQQRLRGADRERLSYLSDDVSARVARKLLAWAPAHGAERADRAIVISRFSRRELAQCVAASEKTVDDVLATLCAAGLITTGRRRFVLLDPLRLQRWADDRSTR